MGGEQPRVAGLGGSEKVMVVVSVVMAIVGVVSLRTILCCNLCPLSKPAHMGLDYGGVGGRGRRAAPGGGA